MTKVILVEESSHYDACAVCEGLIDKSPNRCSKCLVICHDRCMDPQSSNGDACVNCVATGAQLRDQQDYTAQTNSVKLNDSVDASLDPNHHNPPSSEVAIPVTSSLSHLGSCLVLVVIIQNCRLLQNQQIHRRIRV